MTTEAEQRKARSIAILEKWAIPYIQHLPVIESSREVKVRTVDEIARRAVCTLMTIQHACDLMGNEEIEESRTFFLDLLDQWGLQSELTQKEQQIFSGKAEKQAILDMVWKYEAYWVLIWALGFVSQLDVPVATCDCDVAIQTVSQFADLDALIEQAEPRTTAEILDEADLIFRYDWACVEARLKNQPAAGKLDSSVVLERHRALNWLIGYGEDWDHVPTNT
ncbi:DUF4272 domain-containing protein [Listeria costaricensis]|uniref:DUF4272 domain-containing protein n=1 Tax=Listeria costaricensis TaxID=2026604 RepID=UPI000C0753BF|nr:DUF4272 domain-containing protein [Listeria costaricensis]